MLTKILVTALIIIASFYYLRYQRNKQEAEIQKTNTFTPSRKFSLTSQIQWLAGGLAVLTICTVIASFIYSGLEKPQF